MEPTIFTRLIAERLGLCERQVEGTLALLSGGATIPFIANKDLHARVNINRYVIAAVPASP